MINRVIISQHAEKQLRKTPANVVRKLRGWILGVQTFGLEEVRKVPGHHDHPLKGQLQGLRAISLTKQWRAVYSINADSNEVQFVNIEEVHPHDY